jgi:hypothetical protein
MNIPTEPKCHEEECSPEVVLQEWQKEPEVQEYAKTVMDDAQSLENGEVEESVDVDSQEDDQEELLVEEDELADFFALTVEDQDGQVVALGDIIGNTPTLLLLLRHFGCMLCRRLCGHVLQKKMEFYNL